MQNAPQSLSVWEASSQAVATTLPRSAPPVLESHKAESQQTSESWNTPPSPACNTTSPSDSTTKTPYSRKHMSQSALIVPALSLFDNQIESDTDAETTKSEPRVTALFSRTAEDPCSVA